MSLICLLVFDPMNLGVNACGMEKTLASWGEMEGAYIDGSAAVVSSNHCSSCSSMLLSLGLSF
jgi:hypothetical protein